MAEDLPEMLNVGPLWMSTAPGESLTLNVNGAALQLDPGPDLAQVAHLLRISVDCGASRPQSPITERGIHRCQCRSPFRYIEGSLDESVGDAIHDGIDARAMFEERSVTDHAAYLLDVQLECRWSIEPVPDAALERRGTLGAHVCQLPNAIPFDDPLLEPEDPVRRRMRVNERAMTLKTVPSQMIRARSSRALRLP